jgi:ATP-dependent helicase HrpB
LLDASLAEAASEATSFAELDALDLGGLVLGSLPGDAGRLLETETPERIRLAGGRSVEVHYELGKPPWIESRLQDFFGSSDGPRILAGSLPVTLHLCAPNQRAVQVTSDLAGFWERHYPTIRRELMRRYPRHSWPEDGRTAAPPPPRPARKH